MTLAERLRLQREQHRMTLEEVAKQIGVSRQTVFKYENGIITNIPSDKIAVLARIFDVSPAYLMCWTDNPNDTEAHMRNVVVAESMRQLAHVMQYMSDEDYNYVIEAFDRAKNIMKEKGIEP